MKTYALGCSMEASPRDASNEHPKHMFSMMNIRKIDRYVLLSRMRNFN